MKTKEQRAQKRGKRPEEGGKRQVLDGTMNWRLDGLGGSRKNPRKEAVVAVSVAHKLILLLR